MKTHPLVRAIAIVGQSKLAREIGVTPQTVYVYKTRVTANPKYQVPARWAVPIERATRRLVTKRELRPDLY